MTEEKKFDPPLVDDSVEYECKDGHNHRLEGSPECRMCRDRDCSALVGAPHAKRCHRYTAAWMEHIIPHTDLRSITRGADTTRTTIEIIDRYGSGRHLWITCGQVNLRKYDNRAEVDLTCYLTEGVTDFEHDSAYAFVLELIGWTFDSMRYSAVTFNAWIPAELGGFNDFRVPGPGYNPMERDDVHLCDDGHCKEDPHIMVDEGFYIAPANPELFERVKGKRVRVTMRPVYEHEREAEKPKKKKRKKKKAA